MKRAILLLTLILILIPALGCRSSRPRREDPILRLSASEALEQGKALLEAEKYYKARRLLTHAFEVEPNSRSGREALLLSADALFLHGGFDNYIKCETKYRDFLNRFPTSEHAEYAQLQVANCLAKRVERADRDQKVTQQALDAYQELLRLYPTSSYAEEARAKIEEVRDNLAEHEMVIARFYLRYGLCFASIQRLEYLQQEFPTFGRMDEVLYSIGLAYEQCERVEEAAAAFAELRGDHPDSEFIALLAKKEEKDARKRKKKS
ncbi:MAG: outer membrane protein assembly factor BamD [bacterium]|nr:outer membrane protein assembly factor BamD [bacterium]